MSKGKLEGVKSSNTRQSPIDYIGRQYRSLGKDGAANPELVKDVTAYKATLFSIVRVLQDKRPEDEPGFRPSGMNPLMADLSSYFASEEEQPPLSLIFGLHLLIEIYRSFLWKDNDIPNPTDYRLTALKFASQMKKMIELISLENSESPKTGLSLKILDVQYLKVYIAEKCFDFITDALGQPAFTCVKSFIIQWTQGYVCLRMKGGSVQSCTCTMLSTALVLWNGLLCSTISARHSAKQYFSERFPRVTLARTSVVFLVVQPLKHQEMEIKFSTEPPKHPTTHTPLFSNLWREQTPGATRCFIILSSSQQELPHAK